MVFSCSVVSDFISSVLFSELFSTTSLGCWLYDSDFFSASKSKEAASFSLFVGFTTTFFIRARCVFVSFSEIALSLADSATVSALTLDSEVVFLTGLETLVGASEVFCKSNICVINSSFFKVLNF